MHKKGYCHRDLKPVRIVFYERIKLDQDVSIQGKFIT
jgi:hypothetical protein